MRLDIERPGALHFVRAYGPGLIRIGTREIAGSVIVTASSLIEDWRPRHVSELQAADLEPVLELRPEVLLLGSGARQVFPEPSLLATLYEGGVGFEIMDTGAACRTYNVLVAEGRNVAAALIVERA
jgi:uncharacterized protein